MVEQERHKSDAKYKVVIGLPTMGNWSTTFRQAFITSALYWQSLSDVAVEYCEVFRRYRDSAQIEIVRYAQARKATHILFLNDDNPPTPEMLPKLLAADKDIITGIIYVRGKDGQLCVYRETNTEEYGFRGFSPFVTADPSVGLFEIDGCGDYCLLVKTAIYDKLSEPWYQVKAEVNGVKLGHDLYFCKKAREAGFKIWCDPSIRLGHVVGDLILDDTTVSRDTRLGHQHFVESLLADVRETVKDWTGNPAFAAPPLLLDYTVNSLNSRNPTTILEIGSGLSTLLLQKWCLHNNAQLISLESDKDWLKQTQDALKRLGLGTGENVYYAPLIANQYKHNGLQLPWYDLSNVPLQVNKVDFVFLDGPRRQVENKLKDRLPALYLIHKFLKFNFTLVADDLGDRCEQDTFKAWAEDFPVTTEIIPIARGVGVIRGKS